MPRAPPSPDPDRSRRRQQHPHCVETELRSGKFGAQVIGELDRRPGLHLRHVAWPMQVADHGDFTQDPLRQQRRGLDHQRVRPGILTLNKAFVFEFGQVSPREAQDLARHSTPNLTFNVYGRSRENRLAEGIERLASSSPFFDGRRERLQMDAVRTIGAGCGAEDLGRIRHGSELDDRVDHRRTLRIHYRSPDYRGAGRRTSSMVEAPSRSRRERIDRVLLSMCKFLLRLSGA
ncbi:MAG: hypothetical protein VX911_07655 [Candidatus Latescibacterota bacterium]|nr:hypothetical protein [Candidatus Latescibacterota bacterium]